MKYKLDALKLYEYVKKWRDCESTGGGFAVKYVHGDTVRYCWLVYGREINLNSSTVSVVLFGPCYKMHTFELK